MSHKKKSKSIWKTSKYHVPTGPAIVKPKAFVVWEKSSYGHIAKCVQCEKSYHALHPSQKHLVSSKDGVCYHCKDINGKLHAPTTSEQELNGAPQFPVRPITRELWSRGGRGLLHSKKDVRRLRGSNSTTETTNENIHLGRLIKNRLDARYTCLDLSTTIRQKIDRFPLWSCCLQPAQSTECSKAQARRILTEKVTNPVDVLAATSKAFIKKNELPPPDLEQLMDGI
jgi:hypothetical protein